MVKMTVEVHAEALLKIAGKVLGGERKFLRNVVQRKGIPVVCGHIRSDKLVPPCRSVFGLSFFFAYGIIEFQLIKEPEQPGYEEEVFSLRNMKGIGPVVIGNLGENFQEGAGVTPPPPREGIGPQAKAGTVSPKAKERKAGAILSIKRKLPSSTGLDGSRLINSQCWRSKTSALPRL
jgi:hypothetical protein